MASALSQHDRPLTLLFCWLMAKEKHIRKYAKMYTNMGMDVLKIRVSPFDLLRPTKGTQVGFILPHLKFTVETLFRLTSNIYYNRGKNISPLAVA